MNKRPVVSIIIATMNTPELTEACLQTVIKNTSVDYELIVINNSPAKPIRKCLNKFPNIQVIQNTKNLGYTKAANQGALKSQGEFLCFLNSDTLVPPRWMERLLEVVKLPGVGAAGPDLNWKREYLHKWPSDNFKTISASASLIDQAFEKWHKGRLIDANWICGYCLVIPRSVMTSMGPFDERFFFGWEDADYSCRLRLKGYRLMLVKSLFVHHKKRASATLGRHRQLIDDSKKLFLEKWGSLFQRKFSHENSIFSAVDRQVEKRKIEIQNNARHYVKPFTRSGRTLMRRAVAIQLPHQKSTDVLMRLSDMETFQPDVLGKAVWKSLDVSRSFPQVLNLTRQNFKKVKQPSKSEITHRLHSFIENGLAEWSCLPKNRQIQVTVMMAAHNAERWIAEAIESVLSQRFHHFELIIADDNSTDETLSIVRRYLQYPQIRVIQNSRQLGIARTRNRILNLARGKYIAVCDADDIMMPALLERFTDLLETFPRIGWVYSDRLKIDGDNRMLGIDRAMPINGKREMKHNIVAHAGALIRRSEILEVGGYDEAQPATEDYDLALKMAERTEVTALPGEIHYLWRRHTENTSQINPWAKPETKQLVANALRRRR